MILIIICVNAVIGAFRRLRASINSGGFLSRKAAGRQGCGQAHQALFNLP